jgi:two-component system sensor histidine kinase CpxA
MEAEGPATVLFQSDSFRTGALVLDWTPWLLMGGGTLLFSALFWLPFVRSLTRSIRQMTRATEQIAQGRFDVRAPGNRTDELGVLARSINGTAERLGHYVQGQKRFLSDVAHELCSPIARIQLAVGILEQRHPAVSPDYVESVREEAALMSKLVDELLSFSRAGLQDASKTLAPVEVAPLLLSVARREQESHSQVSVQVPGNVWVLAESTLLARAVANLLRNAIRHAGHAGPIEVGTTILDTQVRIFVKDSGPGVPPADLQRIFDPFYRLVESRSRETGGVGLGLAIVKACVEACQGSVLARNRSPSGLEVELWLRRTAPPPPAS